MDCLQIKMRKKLTGMYAGICTATAQRFNRLAQYG